MADCLGLVLDFGDILVTEVDLPLQLHQHRLRVSPVILVFSASFPFRYRPLVWVTLQVLAKAVLPQIPQGSQIVGPDDVAGEAEGLNVHLGQ